MKITFEITEEQERMLRVGQIAPHVYADAETGKVYLQWGCVPAEEFDPEMHWPELKEHKLVATRE